MAKSVEYENEILCNLPKWITIDFNHFSNDLIILGNENECILKTFDHLNSLVTI